MYLFDGPRKIPLNSTLNNDKRKLLFREATEETFGGHKVSESFPNYLEFEIKFSRVLPPKHSIVVNCLSIFRVFFSIVNSPLLIQNGSNIYIDPTNVTQQKRRLSLSNSNPISPNGRKSWIFIAFLQFQWNLNCRTNMRHDIATQHFWFHLQRNIFNDNVLDTSNVIGTGLQSSQTISSWMACKRY